MENVKKIEKDYKNGYTYKKIAEKYNLTVNQIKHLIKVNKWTRKSNRKTALKGNKNAKGNKSSTKFKNGNKAALSTGEYENIFSGVFLEAETKYFEQKELNIKKEKLIEQYKILNIREARMLKRIQKIESSNKDMTISKISKHSHNSYHKSDTYSYYDNYTNTTTEAENSAMIIQKIEDGLTRVQTEQRRCIESLNKIGIDIERLKLEQEKLKIEQKRLEIELQNQEGEEIEDLSETDADIYGR